MLRNGNLVNLSVIVERRSYAEWKGTYSHVAATKQSSEHHGRDRFSDKIRVPLRRF